MMANMRLAKEPMGKHMEEQRLASIAISETIGALSNKYPTMNLPSTSGDSVNAGGSRGQVSRTVHAHILNKAVDLPSFTSARIYNDQLE